MSGAPIIVTKKNVKRRPWRYPKTAVMILLTLPVIYVLSIGPAAWVVVKFDFFQYPNLMNAGMVFYSPLDHFENGSVADRMLNAYLEFWTPREWREKKTPTQTPKVNY